MDSIYKWAVGVLLVCLGIGAVMSIHFSIPGLAAAVITVAVSGAGMGAILVILSFVVEGRSVVLKRVIGGMWIGYGLLMVGLAFLFVNYFVLALLAAAIYACMSILTVSAVKKEQKKLQNYRELEHERHRRLMRAAEHSLERIQ